MKNYLKSKAHYIIILALLAICTRMFVQNYELQQPIINKRSETYTSVWNDRAVCLQQLQEMQQLRDKDNEDILK